MIVSNLPTSLCDSTTLVNNKHSHTSRNQEANLVNILTVRTKTSGSNSIKSKSANIYLNKLFHSEQLIHQKRSFCKLCLTVPLIFIFYSFFFMCLISVCFTCSCIYVSHGFVLWFFGGQFYTSYMLTDFLPSNCKKTILLKNTYLLTQEAPPHTVVCKMF